MKKMITAILAAMIFVMAMAGCSNQSGGNVSISPDIPSSEAPAEPEPPSVTVDQILAAIKNAYGDQYPAGGEIPREILEAEFGLTPDLYEQAKGEMAMMSVQNDRIVVAKAAPGKADELEEVLLDVRKKKIEDTLQYPMNIAKTNASQVVHHGDYVAFLLVGAPFENVNASEQEAKDHAESEIRKAVDAFESVFRA